MTPTTSAKAAAQKKQKRKKPPLLSADRWPVLLMWVAWRQPTFPKDYDREAWHKGTKLDHKAWNRKLQEETTRRLDSLRDSRNVSLGILGAEAFILAALATLGQLSDFDFRLPILLLFLALIPLMWSLIPAFTVMRLSYESPGPWVRQEPQTGYELYRSLCKNLEKRNRIHDQVKRLQWMAGFLIILAAIAVIYAIADSWS